MNYSKRVCRLFARCAFLVKALDEVESSNNKFQYLRFMNWVYLAIAILSEVIATSALKASLQFTRLVPSIFVIVGYASSFYFLSLTLRSIPLGIAYAVWSGVGVRFPR